MLTRLLDALNRCASLTTDADSFQTAIESLISLAQSARDIHEISQEEYDTFYSTCVDKTTQYLNLHREGRG